MDLLKSEALTSELKAIVADIAGDIRQQVLQTGPPRMRAEALHRDERVGTDFDVWTDLLSRRAAVLWVLKTVYIRVLEDRGLLRPVRIGDRQSQVLFERLTSLADTAYLRWIFRDLASPGALPELFAEQPAEIAAPSNALSSRLLAFWRQTEETSGALRYRFDEEHFDGRLMGDLYQDLDPVVKKRFALAQTPDFILDFILDETLTPAIAEFGAESVRVLDPSCGSGHFLLAALKRLVAAMRIKFPERSAHAIVRDTLSRIVGIDINDYACGLARARLVMTALELAGDERLESGGLFHPQVYWADGLEQAEWTDDLAETAGEVRASLSRPATRIALRRVLRDRFHVVVGNPPYITEKDKAAKAYHREKLSRRQRYISASGKYSLGAPFTERMLQLCTDNGFMGEIVANSFMKRNFGKPLIREVLARVDLRKVVDLAGASIPHHGTPTVLLFARKRSPTTEDVLVVMNKKGDPPGRSGQVWASVIAGHRTVGFEDEHVSVALRPRDSLRQHPWSIGGGGAAELKDFLDAAAEGFLSGIGAVGVGAVTGEDAVFAPAGQRVASRFRLHPNRPLVEGDAVRDWAVCARAVGCWPYDHSYAVAPLGSIPDIAKHLWRYRTSISSRKRFGVPMLERGLSWYEWQELYVDKLETPLTIAYGEVATHNHFALDRAALVFKNTAPVIKLRDQALSHHHMVLGSLNSSTACFWMKQVSQPKAGSGIGRGVQAEEWMERYQFSAKKLDSFPLVGGLRDAAPYADLLDNLGAERVKDSAAATVAAECSRGAEALRSALAKRRARDLERLMRMTALQEELDWTVYQAFGLDPAAPKHELRAAASVGAYRPGLRPFEIAIAQDEAEALASAVDAENATTTWFARHGWTASSSLDDLGAEERRVAGARMARTATSRELGLIERPEFKRRWFHPNYDDEEQVALGLWLGDIMEAWARQRPLPFTIAECAADLQTEPSVLALAELIAGRQDFELSGVLAGILAQETVPNQKHQVFTAVGLVKRLAWERTWDLQRLEDGALKRGEVPTKPPFPPEYSKADFLRDSYWTLRGALDVPTERFMILSEVPGRTNEEQLFMWAGLTPRERCRVLVELDEKAERAGERREDRLGLLHGIWFLADYVAWESESAANEFRASVTAVVGQSGVTEELLSEWASRHPPAQARWGKPPRKRASTERDAERT